MCEKREIDLLELITIGRTINEVVRGKYKVIFKPSKTTNSFYFRLRSVDNVYYDLRFSDHKSRTNIKTFSIDNHSRKDLIEFVQAGLKRMEKKQMKYLFKKIAV